MASTSIKTPKLVAQTKLKAVAYKAPKTPALKTSYNVGGVNGGTEKVSASSPKVSSGRGTIAPKVAIAKVIGDQSM